MKKTKEEKVSVNKESKEEYMEEIKKKLPEIQSLEAMKAVYEAVMLCISNETMTH